MSAAAVVVLSRVWASQPLQVAQTEEVREPAAAVLPELAFYRKYTEAMLRRYLRLSMECGRVPSMLGQEMFRGKVTSYQVHGFDDMVIFVHDVEKCISKLGKKQQDLIQRIALEEYTFLETAHLMETNKWWVLRHYSEALDELTSLFLERRLLEPQKACQEGGPVL